MTAALPGGAASVSSAVSAFPGRISFLPAVDLAALALHQPLLDEKLSRTEPDSTIPEEGR